MNLSELANAITAVEFDHPFIITPDGVQDAPANIYAPECYHSEGTPDVDLAGGESEWRTVSDGYTNQYSYNGPVLHASESVSAGMARDFTDPDLYDAGTVFVMCTVEVMECDDTCADDCPGDHEPAGWVILARNA